ncbi:MAG: T9SS type A sorting domain-containing protein [Saprospiraceae bacterium]
MKNFTHAKTILILSLLWFCSFNLSSNSNLDLEYNESNLCEEEAAVSTVRICRINPNQAYQSGGTSGGCAANSWHLEVVDECTAFIQGVITATNLNPNPQEGVFYSLPSHFPDMYIRASYLGGSSISPLNSFFTFTQGDTHVGLDGQSYNLFRVDISIPVDIGDQCVNGSVAAVPMSISLISPNQGLYPVGNFAAPHEAFSCRVFAETCSVCSDNQCGHKDFPPVYDGSACGPCSDDSCTSGKSSAPEKNELIKMEKEKSSEDEAVDTKHRFAIQPNPFTDFFTIKNKNEDQVNFDIEIFDSNGNRVHFTQSKVLDANQTMDISNLNLSPGVYFCKIKTSSEIITKKIIKLK